MFPDRLIVADPWVIIRVELHPKEFKFVSEMQSGAFYLVKPCVAKEVYYLQMLGKNIDLFLPTEGEGLLVRCKAIDSL